MGKFSIVSDSSCDLPADLAKEYGVGIVPIKVSFDRIHKLAEGIEISTNEFYERLKKESITPKTYFPTVREYVVVFKALLTKGQDVLCLCLSSKLSRGYESACNAQKILSRVYKDNKVIVMDTLSATVGQAALTLNAARLRDMGLSVEDVCEKLKVLRDDTITIFTISSLEQLARGGRMNRASANIGTLLHINPIIHMQKGELVACGKAIGRAKALGKIKQLVLEDIKQNMNSYEFTISHSRSYNEAKTLEQDLKSEYGAQWFNPILEIGASIGSHTGESVVALNCMKRI